MKIWRHAFNTYLTAGLLLLAVGCASEKSREADPKKQLTGLRVHMESTPGDSTPGIEVPVYRARPVLVPIERDAFITEENVVAAAVVEQRGGFAIEIQLDRQGTWLLEKYTVTNRGRHLAILCSFATEERWVAAPFIDKYISNGRLVFTPDATRKEAERIVRGLNNVARKTKHDSRF